jgi:hypothetical protein
MNIISNFRDLLNQDVKLMNLFKKIFFIFLAFAGPTTFAHTYNEKANSEALKAIQEYQKANPDYRRPFYSYSQEPYYLPHELLLGIEFLPKIKVEEWAASVNKRIFGVREALDNGADPNLIIYDKTTLFLYMFDCCNDKEFFEDFIKAGANINAQNEEGATALIMLARWMNPKYLEFAQILLDTPGILVNLQDNKGNTALMIAAYVQNRELVERLVEAGARTDIVNNDGKTASYEINATLRMKKKTQLS